MAAARGQVGDFLLVGGREPLRVVIVGRHPAGLRHIEPGFFFRAEGQAVRLIQPFEHGHHGIGHAVAVFIRQGHHPALGGEADQEVPVGVQGQNPGAWQIPGEDGDGKSRRQLQGQGGRVGGGLDAGAFAFLQETWRCPGAGVGPRARPPANFASSTPRPPTPRPPG